MMRRTLLLALAVSGAAAPAAAQSLLSARGLGTPVSPVDARGRALGGLGVGFMGGSTGFLNPADAAGTLRKGVVAAVQPTTGSVELDGVSDDFGGARFPVMNVLYPVGTRWVATAGFGSYLDQSFGFEAEGEAVLAGETVRTRDLLQSTGGLTRLQLGVAYTLRPTLALGLAGGVYTGSVERRVARVFPDDGATLDPFEQRFRWDYLAPHATVGARWDPAPELRLSAAVTVNGELTADSAGGPARDATFDLPGHAVVGASGMLGPDLMGTLGVQRSFGGGEPIAAAQEGVAATATRNTWRLGGGVEYLGVRRGVRTYPVRLGGSWAQLPYHRTDEEAGTEWSVATGLGFRLGADLAEPLALADFALERGGRSGLASATSTGLSESFWRFTFSISLFGQ